MLISNLGFGLLIITLIIAIYSGIAAMIGVTRNARVWAESAQIGRASCRERVYSGV